MKPVAFFNNNGGVGKTSLVYHLAWMFSELRMRVVTADLDPQANLTGMFLGEDRLEELWPFDGDRLSVYGAVEPLQDQTGDIAPAHIEEIGTRIGLIPGDLKLSRFEDTLSINWLQSAVGDPDALRVESSLGRLLREAAKACEADIALIDVGPNLGAINRAAMVAADFVVVPLGPDLFSLQGLQNLGPTLIEWREKWGERRRRNVSPNLVLPQGDMRPAGYVVMRHSVRMDRAVKAFNRWMEKIPTAYCRFVLNEQDAKDRSLESDPNCLGRLKDYRSLMAMAQEAHKPMFLLRPGDGAIGGHQRAVQDCYNDFKLLARAIAAGCGVPMPP